MFTLKNGTCGQSSLLYNNMHASITQSNKITLSIEEVFRCLLYTKGYFLYHYTMKNECAGDGITYISYEEINSKCQWILIKSLSSKSCSKQNPATSTSCSLAVITIKFIENLCSIERVWIVCPGRHWMAEQGFIHRFLNRVRLGPGLVSIISSGCCLTLAPVSTIIHHSLHSHGERSQPNQ